MQCCGWKMNACWLIPRCQQGFAFSDAVKRSPWMLQMCCGWGKFALTIDYLGLWVNKKYSSSWFRFRNCGWHENALQWFLQATSVEVWWLEMIKGFKEHLRAKKITINSPIGMFGEYFSLLTELFNIPMTALYFFGSWREAIGDFTMFVASFLIVLPKQLLSCSMIQ